VGIERVTVPRTVFSKLTTQLQKPDNAEIKAWIAATKITLAPNKDSILWEPEPKLLAGMAKILRREETFVRKKGSCSHALLIETIEKLEAKSKESDVASAS